MAFIQQTVTICGLRLITIQLLTILIIRCIFNTIHDHVGIRWNSIVLFWTIVWTVCVRRSGDDMENFAIVSRPGLCDVLNVRPRWYLLQHDPSLGYVLLVVIVDHRASMGIVWQLVEYRWWGFDILVASSQRNIR